MPAGFFCMGVPEVIYCHYQGDDKHDVIILDNLIALGERTSDTQYRALPFPISLSHLFLSSFLSHILPQFLFLPISLLLPFSLSLPSLILFTSSSSFTSLLLFHNSSFFPPLLLFLSLSPFSLSFFFLSSFFHSTRHFIHICLLLYPLLIPHPELSPPISPHI